MDLIWDDKAISSWPIDFDRYIFIGRAVLKVGRALYGHEWTDADPIKHQEREFYRKPRMTADEWWHDWHLMNAVLSEEERALLPKRTLSRRPPSGISAEIWAIATSRLKETRRSYQRYEAVQSKLLDWFRSGVIHTGLREHRGGEIIEAAPTFWNGEDLAFRFDYGKVDENRPFDPIIDKPSDTLSWIFVDENSLDKSIPNFFPPKQAVEESPRSELLKFAIRFNEKFPLHCFPTKKKLQEEINRAWCSGEFREAGYPTRELGGLWRRVPEAMATVLLDMDDRKGKGKKRR